MKKIGIIFALISFLMIDVKADVADFSFTNVCEGSDVLFTSNSTVTSGTIVAYDWDLNDDGVFTDASGPKVSHVFNSAGSFRVGLRITNSNTTVTTSYKMVVVNPVAKAEFNVSNICLGQKAMLVDNSTLASGMITKYRWDFSNDGMYDDSTSGAVMFRYANPGAYTIGMEVITDMGCVSSIKKPVVVYPVPAINFTFDHICLQDVTEFSATANISGGDITGFRWNFNGDGLYEETTTHGMNTYQFINHGNHQVQVQAVSDMGCVKDTSKVVMITPRPVLNFTFSNRCENKMMSIDNSFSNAASYMWDFGDGNTSTMDNPDHVYMQAGEYTIWLKGSSALGCSDSIAKKVTIYPSPVSGFSYADVCIGDEMLFYDLSTGGNGVPVSNYYWDFGDGHGEISSDPVHTYMDVDSYYVSLVVNNHYGCSDTSFSWVHVFDLPDPTITALGPLAFCDGKNVDLSVSLGAEELVIWSNGESTDMITVDEENMYYVIVYDAFGCQDRDSIMVTVYPLPELELNTTDTFVSKGRSVKLMVEGGVTYKWSPEIALDHPKSANPVATPLENIVYEVKGYSEYNCMSSKTVAIEVINDYLIDMDNLITPNGDGVNDVWDLNLSIYEDNEVILYNKWGTEVFRQKNYQDGWDGTFNGEILPDGTYYYFIRFENSKKVYNGTLTILR